MSWVKASEIDFQIDANTGGLAVIKLGGKSLLAKTTAQLPLCEVGLLAGQEKVFVRPHVTGIYASCTGPDDALSGGDVVTCYTMEFDYCENEVESVSGPWAISGRYTATLDQNGELKWRIGVENNCELPVCEILFPRLGPVCLAGETSLLYPHHAGEKVVDVPNTFASERYLKFWRAMSEPTSFGFAREINYCGLASMTWMDFTNGETGLYVASYDPGFPVTGLRVETGGPKDPWVTLSFRKYVDVQPGQSYDSPEVVWAFHDGDWHEAAKKYRQWFDTLVEQWAHPADLAEEVILSPHYNFRRYEGIGYRFADIPRVADGDREEFGSRHFFIAGWNHLGFDSHYPNYNPDLELGTPLKLQEGCKYVNDHGGFVTFYINCRIMDKYSEYMPTLGERWMLRTEKQEPIPEVYGPAETIVLCPSNPEWRSYLEEFATWMVQAYGARGIYYDQLGSATPYPCYGAHEHGPVEGTSGFNQGYIDLIEKTAARIKALRPDSFLMIENCGDIYSSRVWGSLAWNGEMYDEFFNLYKFTFPEHVLINMVNPRGISDPVRQEEVFYKDLIRAFVLGSVLWFEGGAFRSRVKDEARQQRMLTALHEALRVRRAVAPYLAKVTYRDDLGLTLPDGVSASFWEGRGEGVILVANPEKKAGKITLGAFAGSVGEAGQHYVFTSDSGDWRAVQVQKSANGFELELPKAGFAAFRWRS